MANEAQSAPTQLGATSRFLPIRSLVGRDVICIGAPSTSLFGSERDRYAAVLEVGSVNYALLSDREKEGIIGLFWQFLMNLQFPIQIIVRERPILIEPYLRDCHKRSKRTFGDDAKTMQIAEATEDYIDELCRTANLLSRNFYIVVYDDVEKQGITNMLAGMQSLRSRRGVPKEVKAVEHEVRAKQLLISRMMEIGAGLAGLNVQARKLEGFDLLSFFHDSLRGPMTPDIPAGVIQAMYVPPHMQEKAAAAIRPIALAKMPAISQQAAVDTPRADLSGDVPKKRRGKRAPVQKTGISKRGMSWTHLLSWSKDTAIDDAMTYSLPDLLAPTVVKVTPRYLFIDGEYLRVHSIDGYPRYLYPGWMGTIMDAGISMDVVIHLTPQNSQTMISKLNRRLTQFASAESVEQRQGKIPDIERQLATRDVMELRDDMQQGNERILYMSVYFLVRGKTARQLDERSTDLKAVLTTNSFVSRDIVFEQEQAFRSCFPNRDEIQRRMLLNASTVSTAFPLMSSSLSMPTGAFYGVAGDRSLIILDPFSKQMDNANHVVFAKSGSGKSYFCKVLAIRHYLLGTRISVIDPEHEWDRVARDIGGQMVRIAPGSAHHLNPFDIHYLGGAVEEDEGIDVLSEKVTMLVQFLTMLISAGGAETVSQMEKAFLEKLVFLTYGQKGITSDPVTYDREPPILADLEATLNSGGAGPDPHGIKDRLYPYIHGAQASLFNAPTNINLNAPFVVFNVRDVPDSMRPMAIFVITEWIWRQMRMEPPERRKPRLLFIDEAWTLLRYAEGGRFLGEMARRARKYYLGLVTITQDVEEFLAHEDSRIVMNNASVVVLLRQTVASIDEVKNAFRLTEGEANYLLSCQKGRGLLYAHGARVVLQVVASAREHGFATTDPREITERQSAQSGQ